jgi:hypothetical protein
MVVSTGAVELDVIGPVTAAESDIFWLRSARAQLYRCRTRAFALAAKPAGVGVNQQPECSVIRTIAQPQQLCNAIGKICRKLPLRRNICAAGYRNACNRAES